MDFHWHCAESLPYCESSFGRRRMLRVAKNKDLLRVSRCCDISKMRLLHTLFLLRIKKKKKGKKEKTCSPKCPQNLHLAVIVNLWMGGISILGELSFLTSCVFVYCAHLLRMIFNTMYDCLHACQLFFFLHTPLNSPSLIALMCLTWCSLTRTHFSWCSTCCLCQMCPSLGLCAAVSAGVL